MAVYVWLEVYGGSSFRVSFRDQCVVMGHDESSDLVGRIALGKQKEEG